MDNPDDRKKLNEDLVRFIRRRSDADLPRYTARLKTYVDILQKRRRAAAARDNEATKNNLDNLNLTKESKPNDGIMTMCGLGSGSNKGARTRAFSGVDRGEELNEKCGRRRRRRRSRSRSCRRRRRSRCRRRRRRRSRSRCRRRKSRCRRRRRRRSCSRRRRRRRC